MRPFDQCERVLSTWSTTKINLENRGNFEKTLHLKWVLSLREEALALKELHHYGSTKSFRRSWLKVGESKDQGSQG